jgi:hypothetical protein
LILNGNSHAQPQRREEGPPELPAEWSMLKFSAHRFGQRLKSSLPEGKPNRWAREKFFFDAPRAMEDAGGEWLANAEVCQINNGGSGVGNAPPDAPRYFPRNVTLNSGFPFAGR